MYAVANVKKFVEDHAQELGGRGQAILDRAELAAEDGVFSGGVAIQVMGNDPEVYARFKSEVTTDPEHIRLGLEALTAPRRPSASEADVMLGAGGDFDDDELDD